MAMALFVLGFGERSSGASMDFVQILTVSGRSRWQVAVSGAMCLGIASRFELGAVAGVSGRASPKQAQGQPLGRLVLG